MFGKIFVFLIVFLSVVDSVYGHVDGAKLEEECKIADICRHDQVPICGIDSCGEMRTFIDTCDMHEFNCDSRKEIGTNYEDFRETSEKRHLISIG
uniref:SFRICE_031733 n=1 Tax=Spodoptera frugiperda TaxID=7108 RepID=A0A2H1WMS6_SPOFR